MKAPLSLAIAFAIAVSSGAGSFAIRAAITSVSEVVESNTPSAISCSRNASTLVRLPLCPSVTVRAVPCWTIGWAFVHCVEPVVE